MAILPLTTRPDAAPRRTVAKRRGKRQDNREVAGASDTVQEVNGQALAISGGDVARELISL